MFETVTLVVLGLLVLGIVGSIVPGVPAGLLSLVGIYVEYLYGVKGMGLLTLVAFTLLGIFTVVVDYFGGALVAKSQGASTKTTLLAGAVGLLLLVFTGPIGAILGVFAVVLGMELREGKDFPDASRAAVWSFAGMLGSGLVVFMLTASMLVGYVLFVF